MAHATKKIIQKTLSHHCKVSFKQNWLTERKINLPQNKVPGRVSTVKQLTGNNWIRNWSWNMPYISKWKNYIANPTKVEFAVEGTFFPRTDFLPWYFLLIKMLEIKKTKPTFFSERSEQFLVTECFFNLFLEVSQIRTI